MPGPYATDDWLLRTLWPASRHVIQAQRHSSTAETLPFRQAAPQVVPRGRFFLLELKFVKQLVAILSIASRPFDLGCATCLDERLNQCPEAILSLLYALTKAFFVGPTTLHCCVFLKGDHSPHPLSIVIARCHQSIDLRIFPTRWPLPRRRWPRRGLGRRRDPPLPP